MQNMWIERANCSVQTKLWGIIPTSRVGASEPRYVLPRCGVYLNNLDMEAI